MANLAPLKTRDLDLSSFGSTVWSNRPPCEALPPDTDRGIYADEDEERSALQAIQDAFIPDIRSDPALGPARCNEL